MDAAPLGVPHFHVCGSAEYLKKHGIPKTAKDLDKHQLIVFGEEFRPSMPQSQWLLTAEADPAKQRRPTLRENSVLGIFQSMRSGLVVTGRTLRRALPRR